ncbi:MAG: HAD family hydrolase [Anaerolineae bacterium]|nr:MAG: HAD family hydrolase [Anaerolineae bacterium]
MTCFPWQAVLFDLDGTLRHSTPHANHTLLDFAVALGAQDSPSRRRRALLWAHYYWANSPALLQDLRRYPQRGTAFWTQYTRRQLLAFGCSPAQARYLAPRVQYTMAECYHPEDNLYPGVLDTLETLRQAGYLVGVLTNRPSTVDDYLHEIGVAEHCDLILAAGQIGYWKPDRRIFQAAVQVLGIPASQVLYVGDNYYADVVGARQAGLTPVLVDPEAIFAHMPCQAIANVAELPQRVLALPPASSSR